jgi:hypothetical protein
MLSTDQCPISNIQECPAVNSLMFLAGGRLKGVYPSSLSHLIFWEINKVFRRVALHMGPLGPIFTTPCHATY